MDTKKISPIKTPPSDEFVVFARDDISRGFQSLDEAILVAREWAKTTEKDMVVYKKELTLKTVITKPAVPAVVEVIEEGGGGLH